MISNNNASKKNTLFSQRVKKLAATATLVMVLLILNLAFSPQAMQASIGINDKIIHFVAFAALILPCAIFLVRSLIWILPLTLFFGGTIEILQPGFERVATWADFHADAFGLAAGVVLGLVLRAILKSKYHL